jgi:tetratricopeptide (TPR) repeat protein
LLLALAVALVYVQTGRHGFVMLDDNDYIYDNAHIAHGLTFDVVRWAFTTVNAHNWHPLTWLSHALDVSLYGSRVPGHHITAVVLHGAVTLSLYCLLKRFLKSRSMDQAEQAFNNKTWLAAFGAALFAVHPLHVESVAWVSERKDLLSGLFFMLTLLAYCNYADNRPSLSRYILVVFFYALGLLSKPMLVSLPIILLLLDYWPLGIGRKGKAGNNAPWATLYFILLEKLPLAVMAGLSCLATLYAQQGAMAAVARISVAGRVANALVSYIIYLGQFVFPFRLAVYYPAPTTVRPLGQVLLAIVVLGGITAAVVIYRSRWPCLVMGWLWYLVMLLPVIGLVQVGMQAHADRYTYLPLIGPMLALLVVANDLRSRERRATAATALVATAILALLAAGAWRQTANWRDSWRLWTAAVEAKSDGFFSQTSLAQLAFARGDTSAAIAHARRAVEYDYGSPAAHNNLAVYLCREGRYGEAIMHYQVVLNYVPENPEAHANLATALALNGDAVNSKLEWARAVDLTQHALAIAQANADELLAEKIKRKLEGYQREMEKERALRR